MNEKHRRNYESAFDCFAVVWMASCDHSLVFFFNALAYNLESGSDDAYVYDLLQTRKEEQQFAKVKEIREILLQCALLLTDLVVGWGYIMLFLILPFRMAISYLFYYYSLQHRG